MGFNTNGYVLRPARLATGNARSTGEATTGVDRDHIDPADLTALGYDTAPSRPVEPYADMYRAAVLLKPESRATTEEYIIWAATTGSLSTVESDAFVLVGDPASVTPSAGTLAVGAFDDGTDTFFVEDAGGRDLASVEALVLVRGDNGASVPAVFSSQDPLIGRVVLDAATLTALGGGFSPDRGDTVFAVTYILAAARFWWSRNDQDATRFGWDGGNGRWAPFQGSQPQNVGEVNTDGDPYTLNPPVSRFSIGDVLPGGPGTPDGYALIRAGIFPDAISTPLNVLVVSDSDTEGDYPSAGLPFDAVVGVNNGALLLNPTWADANAGLTLWYNAESFRSDANGDLGDVAELPTDSSLGYPVLSPIPGPTERPFVRIGFRRYLTPIAVDTDADLPLPAVVTERSFYWSRSTGKIVLSKADVDKAKPSEAAYEIAFLGARVYYDGVSLTPQPLTLHAATPILDDTGAPLIGTDAGGAGVPGSGKLFIRKAAPMPPPGSSGVLFVPDGSGDNPTLAIDPETRPNGSGLIRQLRGVGDSFVFASSKAFENLEVEEYADDIPNLKIKVRKNEAITSRQAAPLGDQPPGFSDTSRVQIKRRGIRGEALYFIQAQVTPSVYSEEARLYSRFGEDYEIQGTEVLRFAIDGTVYTWTTTLARGTYDAAAIQANLIADTSPALAPALVGVVRGRVFLSAADPATGTVEIGWNVDADDLSGHASLGFLPGWRVDMSGDTFRWQPDNGASVGLYRSPENLDRSNDVADINAVGKFDNEVLTDNIPGTSFFNVNNPPLEDIPGYDEGVHFVTVAGFNIVRLSNYGVVQDIGVKYEWQNQRLVWTQEGSLRSTAITTPTDTLQLPNVNVLPETVSSEAMAPIGSNYGLYLKQAGATSFTELIRGTDFIMPGNGGPGQAVLVSPQGGEITSGGGGTFAAGGTTFSNPVLSPDPAQNGDLQDDLFAAVQPGYLLQILNGDAIGVYTVTAKSQPGGPGTTAFFTVDPAFAAAGTGISWRIYEAQTPDVFDPTILADVQQVVFNHLPEEPWKIRLLSSTGTVGGSLTAVVADAIESGRVSRIRFGLDQSPPNQATVSYLTTGTEIGILAELGMVIPDQTDSHFTLSTAAPDVAYFQIRIGSTEYNTVSGNLSIVTTFPGSIPAGTILVGEDGSGIAGEIRYAADILADQAGEPVYYDQLFLASTDLAAGESEIDPVTGEVNLSAADLTLYAGQTAYFVEQMITENSLDVTISPINGSILFNKPLREFQIVETEYQQANTDGTAIPGTIIEYLPLIVRLEEGTAIDTTTYSINPTGRTLDLDVEPFIWAGVELQNYAGTITATLNPDSTISFANAVDPSDTVKVNYGVLEAFGGEQAYTVSSFPVFRPPFLLEEEQDTFTLETDRTDDIDVGQLALVGPVPFYVKAVSYDAGADETTVTLWPPPLTEAGSRAPGQDAGFTVTSIPVAITIDPDGSPVAGGGNAGYLLLVDTTPGTGTPLLPADRGQTEFTFVGDLTQFARAGHLLEVGGYPNIIIGADITADGRFTVVSVGNPIYKGFDNTDAVRISARPVYTPGPLEFQGVAPFVEDEDYTLVLFDADGLGTVLVEGINYEADPATGEVTFLTPIQAPLQPGERLVALYTALNPIGPIVANDAVIAPYYKARYLFITLPSATNRILGSTLVAKYTYRAPDTFYFETLPLESYLGEVAQVALSKVSGSSRSGGPVNAFPGVPDNSEQGALGLRSEVRDLKDQDRGARAFIELYNNVILAFEQVLEAMDGRVIGDRDGKFRFFIGHDKRYAPPGYEDQITGDLVKRLVWREIIDEWANEIDLADGYYTEDDPVFDPTTAEEKDPTDKPGETDGKTPNPRTLNFYTALQRFRIKNDMDDRLLIGFGRPRGLALFFPGINVPGLFKDMWEPHVYSRLFPERTKHFTRLFPGLEAVQDPATGGFTDPGFYSPGRKLTVDGPEPGETSEETVKTRNSPIGVIANPAIGNITGIVDVTAEDRRPRARIWAYYPNGDAQLDLALGISTVGKATFVATPLPLSEFPVDNTTGFPDASQLISQGGSLFDLVSGDADLSTPGFETDQQVQFGTPAGPTGTVYALTDSKGNGIFVDEVLKGCVITLKDRKDNSITGDDVFVLDNTPLADVVSGDTGRGDTVFVGPPVMDLDDVPEDGDSPTLDQIEELAQSIPDYRIQFDLKVGKRTGEFIDASLPTRDDKFPLPLRNMFGQRPPEPLTAIEGVVEFVNTSRKPLKLPALQGLPNDDSGDVAIPYMRGTDTELSVLGDVAALFQVLLGSDTTAITPYSPPGGDPVEIQLWGAIYPNEIVVSGEVYQVFNLGPDRNPATMYSSIDVTPVRTAGSYTADSAIGDLRRFDLLLVEVAQPQVGAGEWYAGMTGILTVGDASGYAALTDHSSIEPPRFVTPARLGDLHRYTVTSAYGFLGGAFPAVSGSLVTEVVAATSVLTLDFSSVGGIILDDGSGGGTGGILGLIGTGNVIAINFYDPDPGAGVGTSFVGAILLITTGPGTVLTYDPSGPTASGRVLAGTGVTLLGSTGIRIETTASMLALLPLLSSGTYYDYTITVDTYIDANTALLSGGAPALGTGAGSTTCSIQRDRLTFTEEVAFNTALPRGSTPANGDAIELGVQINVWETECQGITGIAVNESTEVNGGVPFTLQERVGPDPDATVPGGVPYVGTFIVGSSTGKLRMMGWEGHGNTPLPFIGGSLTTGITVASVPSSDLGDSSVILEGSGTMRDAADATATVDGTFAWIDTVTAGSGALANVQAGDIVVVDASPGGGGAVNCGTYLARHVVDTNATAPTGAVPILTGTFATDAGFRTTLDLTFPQVKSISGPTLVLQNVPSVPHSPTDCGFPASGTVYLINQVQYASYDSGTTTYTIIPDSVYAASYSAVTYDASTREATFTLTGTPTDATGASISTATFAAAATQGKQVSGMIYLPFSPVGSTGLPPNNVVGWDEDGLGSANGCTGGVNLAIFGNTNTVNHADSGGSATVTNKAWDKTTTAADVERLLADGDTTLTSGSLGVRVPDPEDSTSFYTDRATSIYGRLYSGAASSPIRGVAAHLSFDGLDATAWRDAHFDNTATIGANVLECLLPGDRIVFGDNIDPASSTLDGFSALSGLFLEPSFPRPTTDLTQAVPHVVAASYPAGGPAEVGHRDFSSFEAVATTYSESVHFYVRRIRRWHSVQADIANSLSLLQYTYEMRVGVFGSYSSGDRKFTANPSPDATNVGNFDNPLVNINSGDVLRILDANGNLIDQAEIQTVVSATVLKLRKPGLTASLASAATFQVWLEQAIVPQEQSNEQLFDLVTDKVVFRRVVDYGAGDTDGGRVPTAFNTMQDSLVTDWAAEGVQEGDYVIIDPAGTLYDPNEQGARPIGDQSVEARGPGLPYLPGPPSALDDNRGFYKVVTDPSTTGADLEVDGASRFGGGAEDGSDDEVFGDSGAEYAVLPTVHNSTLTGDREGQQSLRLTAAPVGTSYLARVGIDAVKSIEPFGYTIIRPCPIFSEDALELVLFMRERMLSLIEEARAVYQTGKGGDYYIFQRDDHIIDVGSPTDPTAGLGIVSNGLITSLEGLVNETPYANVSDCLSVLGRRFWILDFRLDSLGYTDFVDDGFGQRPVQVDLIEDVLDLDDRFRDLRYSWISYRADQVDGSITTARRAEEQLPIEIQKQKELIDQMQALDES
jgi:hypothetical protein